MAFNSLNLFKYFSEKIKNISKINHIYCFKTNNSLKKMYNQKFEYKFLIDRFSHKKIDFIFFFNVQK